MPSRIEIYRGYRVAVYSPIAHFAVLTPPGSNAVIDLGTRQPRSNVVEGPEVTLSQAKALIDQMVEERAAR